MSSQQEQGTRKQRRMAEFGQLFRNPFNAGLTSLCKGGRMPSDGGTG